MSICDQRDCSAPSITTDEVKELVISQIKKQLSDLEAQVYQLATNVTRLAQLGETTLDGQGKLIKLVESMLREKSSAETNGSAERLG